MKFKLLPAVAVALLCFDVTAYAQPYRLLTVDDFRGYPNANNRGVVAYTNCSIDFKYQPSVSNGNICLSFNVRLTMNTDRSWIDRSRISNNAQLLNDILRHEQGHYTIAYLEQQEVLRNMGRTRFTRNYRSEAMEIFNRIDARYKQLNLDYDEDTAHSTNKQQQHSWDLYFEKRLAYMPPESASL